MAAIAHSHQPLALSHVANALCTPTDRSVGRGALVYYAIRIRYTENWNHQRFVEPRATEQRGKLSTEAGTTTAQWQHSPIVGFCRQFGGGDWACERLLVGSSQPRASRCCRSRRQPRPAPSPAR